MKKAVILIAFAVFGTANAQEKEELTYGFERYDFFIEGNVSFSSNEVVGTISFNNSDENQQLTADRIRTDLFTVSTKLGFFIIDNLALGFDIGYITSDSELDIPNQNSEGFNIGPFVRYYYAPARRLSIFNTLSARYINLQNGFTSFESETDGFSIDFDAGIHYFLSRHFIVQFSVGLVSYQASRTDFQNGPSINTDSFSIALNFSNTNIGLAYKF